MKRFIHIFCLFLAVLAVSCSSGGTTTTLSSEAQLSSFTFAKNDSFPGLAAAKFTVKELVDTGLVYNEDSILYGTSLKRVVPKFTFKATPRAAVIMRPDTTEQKMDTIVLSGNDTLDFTRQPIFLTIYSQDATNKKTYLIAPTVHQTDPDLFVWKQLQSSTISGVFESQALLLNDTFVFLTNDGLGNHVYLSKDGSSWETDAVPAGLPDGCDVRQVITDGATLYYTRDNILYTSTDALTWASATVSLTGYTVHSMLMLFNEQVWAVVEDDATQRLMLAYIVSGDLVLSDIVLDGEFPIGGFATVTFPNATGRAHAMVLGGYSRQGASLNSRWSFEYSEVEDKYRVKNFTIEQPSFTSLTGASMVWYDKQIYLFGGINADAQFANQVLLTSSDEGMNWKIPDTTHCRIPATYLVRQKQSAIVKSNTIYLFGGQSRTETYSDVYSGRLNSIDWEKK